MTEAVTEQQREEAVLAAMRAKIAESAAELDRLHRVAPSRATSKWQAGGSAGSRATAPEPPSPAERAEPARTRHEPDVAHELATLAEVAARSLALLEAHRDDLRVQASALEAQRAELAHLAALVADARREGARQAAVLDVVLDRTAAARDVAASQRRTEPRVQDALRWARGAVVAGVGALVAALGSLVAAILA